LVIIAADGVGARRERAAIAARGAFSGRRAGGTGASDAADAALASSALAEGVDLPDPVLAVVLVIIATDRIKARREQTTITAQNTFSGQRTGGTGTSNAADATLADDTLAEGVDLPGPVLAVVLVIIAADRIGARRERAA